VEKPEVLRRPTSTGRSFEALPPSHPVALAGRRAARSANRAACGAAIGVIASVDLVIAGRPAGVGFAVVSAIVAVGLAFGALVARAELRSAAVNAIAAGDDHAGVREFDEAKQLLGDAGYRATIANSLAALVPPGRASFIAYQVDSSDEEAREALLAVCDVLRSEPAPAPRAVALASRLASDDIAWPQRGHDPAILQEELRRIRYHAASNFQRGY
jgi:hypothetical protein